MLSPAAMLSLLFQRSQELPHVAKTHCDMCVAGSIDAGFESLPQVGVRHVVAAGVNGPRLVSGRWMSIHLVSLQCLTYL